MRIQFTFDLDEIDIITNALYVYGEKSVDLDVDEIATHILEYMASVLDKHEVDMVENIADNTGKRC